ncbi:MAG: hypothetical protein ACREJN_07100 [Nitrospiraceae bacterium]
MIVAISPSPLKIPPSRTPRAEGVHVSGIIRCIAIESGILKNEWAEELDLLEINPTTRFDDPVVTLRICIGLAFEEWYIPQLTGVLDHPGEMALAGIYMNHDGEELSAFFMGYEGPILVVHEVKTTYKSTNTVGLDPVTALQKEWMWLAQLKSYCKAAGTRFARLHVLFICGDYRKPIQPQMHIFDIEFTQEELDDNWGLIVTYRDRRIEIEMRQRGL